MSDLKFKLEFRVREYCFYGFKYFIVDGDWGMVREDSVAYTFDENMQPTRDVDKARVVKLDQLKYENYSTLTNGIDIRYNGFRIRLIEKERLQDFLNQYPLPRKSISKITRGNVYAKYNGRCAYCGEELKLDDMQVDHLVAHIGQGGEDTLDNYMPACSVCNRVKSNLSIDNFKESIRHCGRVHRKRKKPVMYDSDKIAIKYGLEKEDHEITLYFEKEI